MGKAKLNNDVLDIIYDAICGYPLEEAYKILEDHRKGLYIPVEFIQEQIIKTSDITNSDELDILYAGNLGYLLKVWRKRNGHTKRFKRV